MKTADIVKYHEAHPYRLPFAFSAGITAFLLFFHSPLGDLASLNPPAPLEVITLDDIVSQRRIVTKELSDDPNAEITPEDRADGTGELENMVDLAFNPSIAPPKRIGSLRKDYPVEARDLGVEAEILVELTITETGKVVNVNIINVRLTKAFPAETEKRLKNAFSEKARTALMEARFSPTVVSGRYVPIRFEFPLRYSLAD